METATLSEARVYVGTYGKYNNGSLFGAWLDLSDYADKEEFYEACRELHKDEEICRIMRIRKSFTKPAGSFTRTRKMWNLCFRITRISRRI